MHWFKNGNKDGNGNVVMKKESTKLPKIFVKSNINKNGTGNADAIL